MSVSSQSTPEGAVGGAKENYPKPQRMNTRMRQTDVSDINQKQVPHKFRKEQETPHPDSYLREKAQQHSVYELAEFNTK